MQNISHNIINNYDFRKKIFKGLLISLVILFFVYVYFIGSITFNILARKTLESKERSMESSISTLELSYLKASNSINKDYALSLGFVDIQKSIFATRENPNRVALR